MPVRYMFLTQDQHIDFVLDMQHDDDATDVGICSVTVLAVIVLWSFRTAFLPLYLTVQRCKPASISGQIHLFNGMRCMN